VTAVFFQPPTTMEALQNRIDSFAKQKRVKNPSKSSSYVNAKWPHSSHFLARPETLAEAGFYYNPSFEDRDNVLCFVCGKQLSEWEEGDDPFGIHWEKCGAKCCWASVRCGLKYDMDEYSRWGVYYTRLYLPLMRTGFFLRTRRVCRRRSRWNVFVSRLSPLVMAGYTTRTRTMVLRLRRFQFAYIRKNYCLMNRHY
jgi:hypothetical protein